MSRIHEALKKAEQERALSQPSPAVLEEAVESAGRFTGVAEHGQPRGLRVRGG